MSPDRHTQRLAFQAASADLSGLPRPLSCLGLCSEPEGKPVGFGAAARDDVTQHFERIALHLVGSIH